MQTADFSEIKGKIVAGVFALSSRTFILQIFTFLGTLILGILLTPADFGVFFIVSAVISFLSYFSDIGFAGALIQKKEEPQRFDYVTAFTIQQGLVLGLILISVALSQPVVSFLGLGQPALILYWSLLFSFFLSSLKTIPSVILERKLEFKLLAIPQIIETGLFYATAILLAYSGWGILSFSVAAVVRGFSGLIAIYILSPWKIGLGFEKKSFKKLFSFGLPFQMNSILALVKDDLMTVFLGRYFLFLPASVLPQASACSGPVNACALGFVGWAKKWAEIPLRLIMDSVIRVMFPAYSRLQENRELLGKAIEKSLFFLALLIFPITFLLILYIEPLIAIIPKYAKWQPAVFSFYLFSLSSIFAAFSSPIVNALNSIGKIRLSLKLMVFWTLMTWIFVPVLTYKFGYNGVAVAALLISLTSVLPAVLLRKFIKFRIFLPIIKPLISSIIMIIPVIFLLMIDQTLSMIVISGVLAFIIYASLVILFMKKEILPYVPAKYIPSWLK